MRPFGTGTDVAPDFAATVGVTLPETGIGELERGEAPDILLRAMFGTRFPDQVLPDRSDRVVIHSSCAPVPSKQEMAERCFNHAGAEEVLAEKHDLFECIRARPGIDFLDGAAKLSKTPDESALQRRVIDYLVAVTFDQAQCLKPLERGQKLKDGRSGA